MIYKSYKCRINFFSSSILIAYPNSLIEHYIKEHLQADLQRLPSVHQDHAKLTCSIMLLSDIYYTSSESFTSC